MSKFYCGMNKRIPSGYDRRGSPEECLGIQQVRWYGLNQIDPTDYEPRISRKKQMDIKVKLMSSISIIRTKVKRLQEKKNLIVNRRNKKIDSEIKQYIDFLKELNYIYTKFSEQYP